MISSGSIRVFELQSPINSWTAKVHRIEWNFYLSSQQRHNLVSVLTLRHSRHWFNELIVKTPDDGKEWGGWESTGKRHKRMMSSNGGPLEAIGKSHHSRRESLQPSVTYVAQTLVSGHRTPTDTDVVNIRSLKMALQKGRTPIGPVTVQWMSQSGERKVFCHRLSTGHATVRHVVSLANRDASTGGGFGQHLLVNHSFLMG